MKTRKRGLASAAFVAASCLGFILLGFRVALALDPRKAITQYVHQAWQTQDGLPQNSVAAAIQTRDGYLWFGTEEGLTRFDGVRFTVFNKGNTPEIQNNYISSLLEARDGGLWIGTWGGGLNLLKGGRFTVYTTRNGLVNNVVRSVCEDREGNIWIGTINGLSRLRDGKFTTYTTKNGLANDVARQVLEDREGNVWIGTDGGLSRLKDGRFSTFTVKDGLPDNRVTGIYQDRRGDLWIGTFGCLVRFTAGKFTTMISKDQLSNYFVRSISEDRDGCLWIGSIGGGLYRAKDGIISVYTTKDGLSADAVLSILEDREGSLWIGTEGGGLNRLRDGKITSYTTQEGLAKEIVWSTCESRDGGLWLGTEGGGLNRLKDGIFSSITSKNGLSNDRASSICESRDGVLWVGTYGGGLNRIKDGKITVYGTKEGLSNHYVTSIYEDHQNELWVGTYKGLNRIKDGKITVSREAEKFSDVRIIVICEDHLNNLWIGTDGAGLIKYKETGSTAFTTKNGLSIDVVLSIYEDPEGDIWIGTLGGGLNRLRDGTFTHWTTKDGLFDDTICQILEDDNGNLWMSCNKGIFRVSKRELSDFALEKIKSVTCSNYGQADGMKSNECNGGAQPAGCKTRDGRLWFPTVKGVVMIDPKNLPMNRLSPPVHIEQFIVNGLSVGLTEKAALAPGRKNFEFHYAGLSYLAPDRVAFRYKLEGFDTQWIDTGTRRTAYYTNIPPGSYRFRVVACNNDGVWNEKGAAFEFSLRSHFYQTLWFYCLCFIGVMGLGATAHHARVLQLRAREKELALRVEQALANVRTLRGLLPICASCKSIRDDRGYWNQLESYFKDHSDVVFSHGLCPKCVEKLYPDVYVKMEREKRERL